MVERLCTSNFSTIQTKLAYSPTPKDKTPLLNNSFVVYKLTCPRCNVNYIGSLVEHHYFQLFSRELCTYKTKEINKRLMEFLFKHIF